MSEEKTQARMRALVKFLASPKLAEDAAWLKSAAVACRSTSAAIAGDLGRLAGGELPPPLADPTVEISDEQRSLGSQGEEADDGDKIDLCLRKLTKLLLHGKIDPALAKATYMVLMGRRYFLQALEEAKAAAKSGDKAKINIRTAAPLDVTGEGGEASP